MASASIISLSIFITFFVSLAISTQSSKQPAFNSLEHLEGCHKGQTVTGIRALKMRLIKLGYLDDDVVSTLTDAKNNGDLFDELLESALKKYQENYHLKVTGALDHDTVKNMMLPRCGNPDIIKNTKKHQHSRSSKFFHMTKKFTFFPGSPKWPAGKTRLTYSFNSSAIAVVSEQTLKSVCGKSFKRWADVTQFTFEEAPQGLQGDLVIGFHRGDHGDGHNFDGNDTGENTLAHAFAPTNGRCHFDADENWSANPTSGSEFDLEAVAIHEIGHLLGLLHSFDPKAIMYASYERGKRDLTQDDINGIRVLYS